MSQVYIGNICKFVCLPDRHDTECDGGMVIWSESNLPNKRPFQVACLIEESWRPQGKNWTHRTEEICLLWDAKDSHWRVIAGERHTAGGKVEHSDKWKEYWKIGQRIRDISDGEELFHNYLKVCRLEAPIA